MEGLKTLLFYLFGLAGLVGVTIFSTSQIERVEIRPLPPHTPTIALTPQSTAASPEIGQIGCALISERIAFGYLPDTATLTSLASDILTISGTVYASDFATPLPEVLIEVWRATPESRYDRFPPFILLKQVRTDAAGRYKFITAKPDHIISPYSYRYGGEFLPIYFHYRLTYQGNCPTSVKLLSAETTAPKYDSSASTVPQTLLFKRVKPDDTLLQGPVDVALPVSPPTSSGAETGR